MKTVGFLRFFLGYMRFFLGYMRFFENSYKNSQIWTNFKICLIIYKTALPHVEQFCDNGLGLTIQSRLK